MPPPELDETEQLRRAVWEERIQSAFSILKSALIPEAKVSIIMRVPGGDVGSWSFSGDDEPHALTKFLVEHFPQH